MASNNTKQPLGWLQQSKAFLQLDGQLKALGGRVSSERKALETKLAKTQLYRKAQEVRKRMGKQAEQARDKACQAAGLATKAEFERLNRKLNTISRKVSAA